MNDLQEQVKVEDAPTDKNEHGVEVSTRFPDVNRWPSSVTETVIFEFEGLTALFRLRAEQRIVGPRGEVFALRCTLHQVHRDLSQA